MGDTTTTAATSIWATPADSPPNAPLIALDLDDVLMATNSAIARWHTKNYSPITIEDFHYYHYWKNPGWGSPQQTLEKVGEFYQTPEFRKAPLVDGAYEGVRALRKLGFRLVIVTARINAMKEFTEAWVGEHFRGCFEAVHYTGQFERKEFLQTLAGLKAVNKKLEKIEVLQSIGAVLLVDDSLENATTCVTDPKPVPVLLFGPWPWNRHRSYARNEPGSLDFLSYDERRARGLDSQADAISDSELPNGMQRAQNWDEVVQAVKKSFPA